jgi:NAD(P)-dependent dehydrogenase (short-subunit alcohol dehydrogenase family)
MHLIERNKGLHVLAATPFLSSQLAVLAFFPRAQACFEVDMYVKDAVVFVTGGRRGLGLAFAKEAIKLGARKVYVGVRNPEAFAHDSIKAVQLDVTRPDSVVDAAAQCQDVNILVNNAGIVRLPDGFFSPELIDISKEIFETNYYGVVRATEAFVPIIGRNGAGAVVNVLSDATWVSVPMLAPYAASKHAAWSFTNSLRLELKHSSIQVLGLHVGFLDTDMTAGVDVPKSDPNYVAAETWRALEADQFEYLGDEGTRFIKSSLSGDNPAYISPVNPF